MRGSIIVDDDIKIAVLSDKRGQVVLGIESPEDIEIWREEIFEAPSEWPNE